MLCFMAHFHTRAFSSHVTRSDPHLGTPDYTAGPAKLHQEPAAVLEIVEVDDRFSEGGEVHTLFI
jgi:hypothetical protein